MNAAKIRVFFELKGLNALKELKRLKGPNALKGLKKLKGLKGPNALKGLKKLKGLKEVPRCARDDRITRLSS